MESNNRSISVDEEIKVLKLKVKAGAMLYDGQLILIYESVHQKDDEPKQKKLKTTEIGVVKKILVKEGDILAPGSVIIELEKKCSHPTVIKDLCAECGADLQKEDLKEGGQVSQASVSMIHMIPELKVDQEHAQILGKADMDRLLEHKKLVLLVDLDQTLIHTTNDNIPNNIKDVYHFQLDGSQPAWYHTRLRPGTHSFLQGISEKYELHICTFGSRRYAHTITRFLDPDGKLFSHRILSRDECFDPNSKTANLRALFPCGEKLVCIIDDREDVWEYASNLIHVKPYRFFQHTGDIHAPPGLTKCENDDKQGYDFSQINETQNNESTKSEGNNEETPEPKIDKEVKEELVKNKEDGDNTDDVLDQKENLSEECSSRGDAGLTKVMKVGPEETPLKNDSDQIKSIEKESAKSQDTTITEVSGIKDIKLEPEESAEQKALVTLEKSKNLDSVEFEIKQERIVANEEISAEEKPNDSSIEPTKKQAPDAMEEEISLDENPQDVELTESSFKKETNEAMDAEVSSGETPSTPEVTEPVPKQEVAEEELSNEGTLNDAKSTKSFPKKENIDAPDLTTESEASDSIPSKDPDPTKSTIEVHHLSTNRLSRPIPDENGWITIEETDDYLLYLEEILKTIHSEFFKFYEETKIIPDLKEIVPETRAKVLKGVSIVFSGIVPNHINLEKSQAYKIARSLGAKVTQNIEPDTTHLVALRAGTAKVLTAYKRKNLKLVTPEWLWTCAERWEKVDERMFPLRNAKPNTKSRDPPDHCRSPEHPESLPYEVTNKSNPNQVAGFMYSINPLMSLSSEDIETMAGEVDDMFKESDGEADGPDDAFTFDDNDDENDAAQINTAKKRKLDESSSSSGEEDETRFERFSDRRKRKKCKQIDDDFSLDKNLDDEDEDEDSEEDDDETINTKFRRGEKLPSDLDMDFNSEEGSEEEQESDGEWNVMGAALEREFLEGE